MHQVNYFDLLPGKYIFRVKAANSDGVWSTQDAILKINKLPPYYRTVWAYLSYVSVAVVLLIVMARKSSQRIERKNRHIMQEMEDRKEKELYQAKIDFFTNVTHEIRTPLSLIKLPLDEVMKHVERNDPHWENLSIIQRNANRLLKLSNELLDFRKAESKGMRLHFVPEDVAALVRDTVASFEPSANLQKIMIETDLPDGGFEADVNAEVVTKIMSNLLNNALKHARSIIRVRLSIESEKFRLIISNDGEPVPAEMAEKIFKPFFKINEYSSGSGIGLPFARALIELHDGAIFLDQESNVTTFVMELPIHQESVIRLINDDNPPDDNPCGKKRDKDPELTCREHKRTILLVEDSAEFLWFTANQLSDDYDVLEARDGKQALALLDSEYVDMIISDIMMPVMDGMALCRKIKETLKYSHIPVILLTAKTSLQSKLEGLKTGADEYIEKPFSIDYLKARITNLIDNREKIRKSYIHSPELAYDSIVHSKADEEFLNNLIQQVYARLEDVDLNVDKLASVMNMSRASLYRKVKSISELTPNDFIRLIRLKKAAELLREKEYRVNEIAFIVGFNSPSYFSKCFYKQFGVLPKYFERGR
jgi:signal transduction histidine kinase/DNA-binding response OmpR family regulator